MESLLHTLVLDQVRCREFGGMRLDGSGEGMVLSDGEWW